MFALARDDTGEVLGMVLMVDKQSLFSLGSTKSCMYVCTCMQKEWKCTRIGI